MLLRGAAPADDVLSRDRGTIDKEERSQITMNSYIGPTGENIDLRYSSVSLGSQLMISITLLLKASAPMFTTGALDIVDAMRNKRWNHEHNLHTSDANVNEPQICRSELGRNKLYYAKKSEKSLNIDKNDGFVDSGLEYSYQEWAFMITQTTIT